MMKCICPMGGDRPCPDNCLLRSWHGLSDDQKTKERRLPIVQVLAEQGYTQDAMAIQLSVDQRTVGRDLETLGILPNVKGQGKDKLGRKRSSGRPKSEPKRKRVGPQRDRRVDHPEAARLVLDEGLSYEQAAERCDVTLQVVRASVQREEGRQERRAEPEIALADLTMTQRQKAEAWQRQEQKRMERNFESRVLEECNKRLNELSLPAYVEEMAKLEHSITSRKGIMTQEIFKLILRCLHPDKSASIERHNKAFHEFNSLEKRLLDEKDSPTVFRPMPKTAAEMMAMRKSKAKKPSAHSNKRRLSA